MADLVSCSFNNNNNSSPMMKGFFALAIRSATKYDTVSAAFKSYCSLCSIQNNLNGLSLNAGCLVSRCQSNFVGFMDSLDNLSPHILDHMNSQYRQNRILDTSHHIFG